MSVNWMKNYWKMRYIETLKEIVIMSKGFEKVAAQGDVMLIRVEDDQIPVLDGWKESNIEGGKYIVAHSETGHHHVVDSDACVLYENPSPNQDRFSSTITYLKVDEPTDLIHEREFDTHETLNLSPGFYKVKRQREYTPRGDRMVMD